MNGIPKVVFDTNILFSALGWKGSPFQCVQQARRGICLSLTCEPILAELAEKIQRKRGLDRQRAVDMVNEVLAFSNMVNISGTLKIVRADPDDDAVLECAVAGRAQFLVSGDKHLLALGKYEAVQIVKAAEFLSLLQRKTI